MNIVAVGLKNKARPAGLIPRFETGLVCSNLDFALYAQPFDSSNHFGIGNEYSYVT